ncbi:hypothetical protein OG426_09550 [Streptomyces canus]|uniref:hypothetical protein n=1 Tax=Streptomyces canus TaxID=58343 RepID=UPI00225A13A8|nr:hypothetical protein [Streptomyces canus]MCX4862217.1 hypothetical protein [Streptomyces canus]WSW32689.1 hypothetical protein OG426_09550 [Streptomyces canus]
MNEERIRAALERRLVHDDPPLAATMAALNQQFRDKAEGESLDGHMTTRRDAAGG